VSEDPHALKLYVDGNSYKNPGGAGAFACVAEFPSDWERDDETIFAEGFFETTINRMELCACIRALEYVADQGIAIGVQRVQIITDSLYVFNGSKNAHHWRAAAWRNHAGRPIKNAGLWKKFLSVQVRWKVRTDILWRKGKKSSILRSVDRAAKEAGKAPTKTDRGFRSGKVGRSKVHGGSSTLFPAAGQSALIRIYKSALIRKTEHKIYFDLGEDAEHFASKHTAYVPETMSVDFRRRHGYLVKFNNDPKYPMVVQFLSAAAPLKHLSHDNGPE
jgi:ribonuclease HI